MNFIFSLVNNHRLIATNLILLAMAYFSFQYFIERLLTPKLGMGWAFVIDQTVPLIIALATTYFFLRKKGGFKTLLTRLQSHYRLLLLIFTIAFVTHLGILTYYFWSDEVILMLKPITQNEEFKFHRIGGANMRGYFIASYALTYLLFGTHAWVYPLISITTFAVSALFVYWFLYLLTKRRLTATLASLFFATTPIFLDMFTWHSTAHAPILIFGLTSFIFLLYYKKNGQFIYYILSLMFFFVVIKMGFVRSVGFTFIPLLLIFLPLISKTRQKIFRLVLLILPYILITVYFVLFEFVYKEIEFAKIIFDKTRHFNEVINYFLQYRSVNEGSSLFPNKLSFYTTYLFIPSGLAAEVLPVLRPLFPKISLVLNLGNFILLCLLSLFLIGLRFRHTKNGWLIIFAISFIFMNMLHSIIGYQPPAYFDMVAAGSTNIIDKDFTGESLGYGPGSRYLFISSVGVSLLFSLSITWLIKKGRKFILIAMILGLIILSNNVYFTIRAQVENSKQTTPYKSLVENIFKTVPRDGKPKILFSGNPAQNGLDSKFSGWEWLQGFYKKNELIYTKDPKEVEEFIKNKYVLRENLYAFYNNPSTLVFKDISEEARDYFFSGSTNHITTDISFQSKNQNSLDKNIKVGSVNFVPRAIIESFEINKQILVPQTLRFKLNINRVRNPPFPFSDTIFFNTDRKYGVNFPMKLWELLELPPRITNKSVNIEVEDASTIHKQSSALKIIQKREDLMMHTKIRASNIEDGNNITEKSLIDGFYTTYPNISAKETFFVAKENPVVLTLSLPYITGVNHILFNTPINYSVNYPKEITILSSQDGLSYEGITTWEDKPPMVWSPNKASMYRIDLPKTIYTRFLKIEIAGNARPVALDEIVINGEEALDFSPKDIYEAYRKAYNYVANDEYLNQLAEIKSFNRLYLLWACADDADWQQQKNQVDIINGIWNVTTVNLLSDINIVDEQVQINCYGTKLRKLFLVGPPYPAQIELIEAMIGS